MTPFTRIALIGFGEVGQILADDLAAACFFMPGEAELRSI